LILYHRFKKNAKIRAIIAKSWAVSWPMTLIMFFVFLIGLTDVYIAGKFGKDVQAAYGIVFQLYFIFSIVASALSIGTVSVISRLFTSGRKQEYEEAVYTSFISGAVSGLILSAAGIIVSGSVIRILNIPSGPREYAVSFMKLYSIGLLANYILLNTNAILRACSMIRKSLITMFVVCCVNIALNFFLVFHTPLSFRGIALATIISMSIGGLMNAAYLKAILLKGHTFSWQCIQKIIAISWPSAVLQVLWQVGTVVLFMVLSFLPRDNVETMAAFTNGLKVESAIFLPAFAFNMANAVVVGNLLGKKEKEDAFRGGIITGVLGVGVVVLLTLIVMLNAGYVSSILSNNSIVVEECRKYIYISLLSEPFMAWGVILSGGLNGAGDTRSVMFIVALSMWFIRLPLSYILSITFGWGASAVWWAMNTSVLVQTVFLTWRYFSKRWMDCAE